MSVLSDVTIAQFAHQGMIQGYEPTQVQKPGIISYGISSCGYDTRVGSDFYVFESDTCRYCGGYGDKCSNCRDGKVPVLIDPKDFKSDHVGSLFHVANDSSFPLPANSYALCHSMEYFKIPLNIFCLVIGKSTYARCGLMINCTPLEPGWEGQITLELANLTKRDIRVYAGQGIAQIIFLRTDRTPRRVYNNLRKYQGQRGITFPKRSIEQ